MSNEPARSGNLPSSESLSEEFPPRACRKATVSLILGVLSLFLTFLAGIPAIIFGISALVEISQSDGRVRGRELAMAGTALGFLGPVISVFVLFLVVPALQAAKNQESLNHLKQIGTAFHNYHDLYKSFPMTGSNDPQYRVGLSWRVRTLPFIGREDLLKKFNPHEPWDGPHNKPLISQMPDLYKSPGVTIGDFKTVYLAVVTTDPNRKPQHQWAAFTTFPYFSGRLANFVDGTAETIMVVEANADQAVIWTKPDDWDFDPQNPRRGLGKLRPGGFLACFADSGTRFIPLDTDDEMLVAMFTPAGGENLQVMVREKQRAARESAEGPQSSEMNLKQIGLAMHNYQDVYKSLPLVGSKNPKHGIRISWRVRLLPYIEHFKLFNQVDFNEPFDSPKNKAILPQMPMLYKSRNYPVDDYKTVYLAPVMTDPNTPPNKQTMFSTSPPFRDGFGDVSDGLSNTIMLVEADKERAVTWTAPDDLNFDPQNPRSGLGHARKDGILTLLGDGSVRVISQNVSDDVVRAMMTKAGKEKKENIELPVLIKPEPKKKGKGIPQR